MYDEEHGELVMAGGTGEAGATMLANGHKLSKGQGLVGRAAESNEPILVNDTSRDPNWLPNPLLPETKSEVAMPISIGNKVLGVLDIQHNIVDGLKREDVDSLQSIANQVAIALQNIGSVETMTKRAKELGLVPATAPVFIRLADGKIVGVSYPAGVPLDPVTGEPQTSAMPSGQGAATTDPSADATATEPAPVTAETPQPTQSTPAPGVATTPGTDTEQPLGITGR